MWLEASSAGSLATRQRDLFGFEVNADSQREISSLLDRLSDRLGTTAVVHAELVADARPELAVTFEDETGIVNLIVQPDFCNATSRSSMC